MKNYRIVRIVNYCHYDPVTEKLYHECPDFDRLSYAEQQKRLFASGAIFSDAFSRTMQALGNEAHEIVYDFESLQKTWAREQGITCRPEHWKHEILLAQLSALRPDVVYCQGIYSFPRALNVNLKERFPFIRVLMIYAGFPVSVGFDWVPGLDYLPCGTPALTEKYKAQGLNATLVYHGFDVSVWEDRLAREPPVDDNLKYPFVFLGTSGFGTSWEITHISRFWLLVEIMTKTPLQAWVFEPPVRGKQPDLGDRTEERDFNRWLRRLVQPLGYRELCWLTGLLGDQPDKFPRQLRRILREAKTIQHERRKLAFDDHPSTNLRHPAVRLGDLFPERCHAPVFGLDMYRILHGSKISLNRHTNYADGCVGNIRMFETTGVGACLLTDRGANLADLFQEDAEVVAYSSADECVEKARYLLEHDDVRRRIAAAGQRRTLRDHEVSNRFRQMDEEIQKLL